MNENIERVLFFMNQTAENSSGLKCTESNEIVDVISVVTTVQHIREFEIPESIPTYV